nr:codanin-1-like [Penaeus vannamei]
MKQCCRAKLFIEICQIFVGARARNYPAECHRYHLPTTTHQPSRQLEGAKPQACPFICEHITPHQRTRPGSSPNPKPPLAPHRSPETPPHNLHEQARPPPDPSGPETMSPPGAPHATTRRQIRPAYHNLISRVHTGTPALCLCPLWPQISILILMQLEDNFFHNNPSSVRKTTEFVIERVSSNVIKKIRTKIIPEQREAALEKLKAIIDEQMKNSPQTVERTRDIVQKQVMDLSQELAQHIRAQCTQVTHQECQGEVLSSLTFLMPPDMTPQALDVCRKIVSRSCQEKVLAWVQSHLTPVLFSKDLSADGDRLLRQAQKAADFQAAALQNSLNDTSLSNLDTSEASATMGTESSFTGNQSGLSLTDHPLNSPTNHPHKLCPLPKKPTNPTETLPITASEHIESLPSPSKIIMDIKEMVRIIVLRDTADSDCKPSEEGVGRLLGDIRGILTGRQDVNLTVFRVLESLTVDLAVSLAVCLPDMMTPKIQETFIELWQPLDKNGVIPSPCGLASPLNPRTVMLIAQSPSASHQRASWAKLENFLTALLINKLVTPASLQEQCIALLRHSWPQEILTGMSSCIEAVSKEAQKNKDLCGNPTLVQLLEWVGWVCGQMEDFPDVL